MSGNKALRARAHEDAKVARAVLASHGIGTAGTLIAKRTMVKNREVWAIEAAARMEVWKGELPGRWRVKVDLMYDVDPLGASEFVFVRAGSLGLAWEKSGGEKEKSFVRYDVDVDKAISFGDPCHFHVLQAEKLNDRVHFRVPAVGISEWPLGPTLEFLCSSQLRDEIKERL